MPLLQVKTTSAEQVWASPDGNRKIYKLTLDYQGKPVSAKTFSHDIAVVGWEGEVDLYEKEGKQGLEVFVRQAPKEGGSYGQAGTSNGSTGTSKPSYVPKDEKAIQAMWAISQAIQVCAAAKMTTIPEIEVNAQELFLMVDRIKVVTETPEAPQQPDTIQPVPEGQLTVADIKDVLGDEEV